MITILVSVRIASVVLGLLPNKIFIGTHLVRQGNRKSSIYPLGEALKHIVIESPREGGGENDCIRLEHICLSASFRSIKILC